MAGTSISSEDECYDALLGLGQGDTAPLLHYLEQETGTLHPLVQRELAEILRGNHLKLQLKRGGPRGRPRSRKGVVKGQTGENQKACTAQQVGRFLMEFTGDPGKAVAAAAKQFQISPTQVRRQQQEFEESPERLKRLMNAATARQ